MRFAGNYQKSFQKMIKRGFLEHGTENCSLITRNTYILEKHRDIKAVWITKEKNLALAMRELGYKCYFYHEWRGIVSSVRAAVIFTTSGYGDVAEWAHPNTLHVSLWHGTPLKKIGYDNIAWEKYLAKSKIQKFKEKFIPYVNRDSIHTIYTVSSEEVKNKFITAFRAMPNQVFITGQPRNDCFIHPKNNEYFDQIKEKNPDVKIVCYLPTHRNFGTQNNSPINKDVLKNTDSILRENNIILIFKPHFHELKNYLHIGQEFTNIILGTDEKIFSDVYAFLPYCDALISDYSSVFVDYLCSGKPIVLFPYDLDAYLKSDAGLYYNFDDVAPGDICFTWEQVLDAIVSKIREETQNSKYCKLMKLFNHYNDGCNCERVYDIVINLLMKKVDGRFFDE